MKINYNLAYYTSQASYSPAGYIDFAVHSLVRWRKCAYWPLRARGLGLGARRCLVGREHLPDSVMY